MTGHYPSKIYLLAIEEFAKADSSGCPYLFIYSNSETDSLLNNRKIQGREIICVKNEEDAFKYMEQSAVILELEPMVIDHHQITVKISHNLFVKLKYPFNTSNLKNLSETELSNLKRSIERAANSGVLNNNNTFSSLNQSAWTFVELEKNESDGEFYVIGMRTEKY